MTTRYPNGQVPEDLLIREGGNWFFPGTYRKFEVLRDDVKERHGVTLYVTPPAYGAGNAYRSLEGQQSIRAALGIQASVPGRSSHGGLWTGQTTGAGGLPTWVTGLESGALDIANWAEIGFGNFKAAAQRAGFIVDVVVPQELWHIVDLDPWATSASGGGAVAVATPDIPTESEEDDIMLIKNSDTGQIYSVGQEFIKHLDGGDGEHKAWIDAGLTSWIEVKSWSFTRILRAKGIPDNVIDKNGRVLDALNGQGKYVKFGSWSRGQETQRLAWLAQRK